MLLENKVTVARSRPIKNANGNWFIFKWIRAKNKEENKIAFLKPSGLNVESSIPRCAVSSHIAGRIATNNKLTIRVKMFASAATLEDPEPALYPNNAKIKAKSEEIKILKINTISPSAIEINTSLKLIVL